MKVLRYWDFSFVPDKSSEDILLPLILQETDNSQEYIFCKAALKEIIQSNLSLDDQQLLQDHYSKGISKTQLAKNRGVVPSTIGKRINKAHQLVANQLALSLKIYRRYKKEKSD